MQTMLAGMVLMAAMLNAETGQARAERIQGRAVRIKVHGKSLEGNLSGDPADRDVSIYLPASYDHDKKRRYPAVYLLHGFTDSDEKWFGMVKHFVSVPASADKMFSSGAAREMILVMPNAFTAFKGSMYGTSVTTGDWDGFVSQDLVAYIDSHYRTIPELASRGLAGHSMGGYGTIRIGMKHPEVFSSLYLLSPCCMAATPVRQGARLEEVKTKEDVAKADFFTSAGLASAAAWSPNPKNPPFFIDLPVKDGKTQPSVLARWAANAPLAMLDQYIPALRKMKAIGMDAGAQDEPIAGTVRTLDDLLTQYGIAHDFEIYEGNHVNHVADRLESKVFPFFSKHLSFGKGK